MRLPRGRQAQPGAAHRAVRLSGMRIDGPAPHIPTRCHPPAPPRPLPPICVRACRGWKPNAWSCVHRRSRILPSTAPSSCRTVRNTCTARYPTAKAAWLDFTQCVAGWLLRGHGLFVIEPKDGGNVRGFVLILMEFGDREPELGWFLKKMPKDTAMPSRPRERCAIGASARSPCLPWSATSTRPCPIDQIGRTPRRPP